MTDTWFIDDIERIIKQRGKAIILDPNCLCEFLMPLLEEKDYLILRTDPTLSQKWQQSREELLLRQEAETAAEGQMVIFYVTRPKEKLSFLFDYCFTHGCLDLTNPGEWLRKKIFSTTGLQVQFDNPQLITAAKLGIGKDRAWWQRIIQGLSESLNLEDELLPFFNDPNSYLKNKDSDIKRLFEEKVFELLDHPYMKKPANTLANEVVKRILDGLVYNDLPPLLLQIYYRWADSETYRSKLDKYIQSYKLDKEANPWQANPDHCFEELDLKAFKQLSSCLRDKSILSERLGKIKIRVGSGKVKAYIPTWWQDVLCLIEFDNKPLAYCKSFNAIVDFYTNNFAIVDRSIRNIYATFLHEENIVRPFQEYYEIYNRELLEAWYKYLPEYKSNQKGFLIHLLKSAKPKLSVIVGDGLRYEIAQYVANSLQHQFKVDREVMLGDMPSETEHNMSALYVGKNEVTPIHSEREKQLVKFSGKDITFINLESLHYGINNDYIVLTYKDIDSTGEKLQQGALKLFEEFEQVLIQKIQLLLKMGYNEVHVVTDHGFVLTGLLDEADKIEPKTKGKTETKERFLRTVERQENKDYVEFNEPYGEYEYVYASKSARPFKSKGMYGYSHGGFTPQEIILPKFVFSKFKQQVSSLEVKIVNKEELRDVTGDIFAIKLQAASAAVDIFAAKRMVQLLLFAGGQNYLTSSIFTLEPGKTESPNFSFNKNQQVEAVLIDANTSEQLDTTIIKQSTSRDLGGL